MQFLVLSSRLFGPKNFFSRYLASIRNKIKSVFLFKTKYHLKHKSIELKTAIIVIKLIGQALSKCNHHNHPNHVCHTLTRIFYCWITFIKKFIFWTFLFHFIFGRSKMCAKTSSSVCLARDYSLLFLHVRTHLCNWFNHIKRNFPHTCIAFLNKLNAVLLIHE